MQDIRIRKEQEIKREERIFNEIDLDYDKEYFDSPIGMTCKRIHHCSCDCDRCTLIIF